MKKKQYISPVMTLMTVDTESLMLPFSSMKVGDVEDMEFVPVEDMKFFEAPQDKPYEYGEIEID